MVERKDIVDRKDIETLVIKFYDRAQADPLLGPLFSHVDWAQHLPVMHNFWSSILFGDGSYVGNPFQKHANLPLETVHFNRWVTLFLEAVHENFSGEKADEIKMRAQSIAQLFQHKMKLIN